MIYNYTLNSELQEFKKEVDSGMNLASSSQKEFFSESKAIKSEIKGIQLQLKDRKKGIEEQKVKHEQLVKKVSTKAEEAQVEALRKDSLRFALYDDLKDLYKKVMPSLADTEKKLVDFWTEND